MTPTASDLVPHDADLPGSGWLAVDEGFGGAGGGDAPLELIDCVGPEFPEAAVVATASSPHFFRPPGRLVHGIGVVFASEGAADEASEILSAGPFAECLGRSVSADLAARPVTAELLAVQVGTSLHGHRVVFTGGDAEGVRAVQLDIVALRAGAGVSLLWFADTPDPFPLRDADHLVEAIRQRLSR